MNKLLYLLFSTIIFFRSDNVKVRRIIIKEYAGATILPTGTHYQVIFQDLYNGRFIKVKLFDYRGKMFLQCYSKDSVLLEEGNYINSLKLYKKHVTGIVSQSSNSQTLSIEYYEPRRNGKWLFYNAEGIVIDSAFYNSGILIKREK